jgi:mono/diheme cytochrome c family protein
MKRPPVLPLFGLLWAITACVTANVPPTATATTTQGDIPETAVPLPTFDPVQITLGETVYAEQCAECHGANLEGEPDWKEQNEDNSFRAPPHTADGHTWHHPDDQLLEAIQLGGPRFEGLNIGGTSDMPAFEEELTDEEITAVLTFIKSTWPDDIRAVQWQQTQQAIQFQQQSQEAESDK